MGLYALSVQPLITGLGVASSTKQGWFAGDACGAGSLLQIKKWWDALNTLGGAKRTGTKTPGCGDRNMRVRR